METFGRKNEFKYLDKVRLSKCKNIPAGILPNIDMALQD